MPHIIIGHTTTTTSTIWARATRPGTWWLAVSERPFKVTITGIGQKPLKTFLEEQDIPCVFMESKNFSGDDGLTQVFNVSNLKADVSYYYALVAAENITGLSGATRVLAGNGNYDWFRTPEKNADAFTFGFYSCNDFLSMGQNLWSQFYADLSAKRARFAIGGGDQVYSDSGMNKLSIKSWIKDNLKSIKKRLYSDGVLDKEKATAELVLQYRNAYDLYWKDESLGKVYSRFPQYMIWDDHEIYDGWGSHTEYGKKHLLDKFMLINDPEFTGQFMDCVFAAASKVYNEFQHSHNPGKKNDTANLKTCEWDYSFEHGKVGFYVWDMRGHKNVSATEGFRILGYEQRERFKAWLNSEDTKLKKVLFIVSPVPMIHWKDYYANHADFYWKGEGTLDDFRDEWGQKSNYIERNWLLDLLLKASLRPQKIVLISGDVHSYSVYKVDGRSFKKEDGSRVDDYVGTSLFNVTASGITRKPAPGFLRAGFCKTGDGVGGFDGGVITEKLGDSGVNNYAMIHVDTSGEKSSVKVEVRYYDKKYKKVSSEKVISLE